MSAPVPRTANPFLPTEQEQPHTDRPIIAKRARLDRPHTHITNNYRPKMGRQ
jgi:hypothetical protein